MLEGIVTFLSERNPMEIIKGGYSYRILESYLLAALEFAAIKQLTKLKRL